MRRVALSLPGICDSVAAAAMIKRALATMLDRCRQRWFASL
jgi:hypothetical protein